MGGGIGGGIARGGALAEEFTPATFVERGLAVPFTTPLLSQARLRLDAKDRFEFLLPNFTGGKGVYVVPWKTVPSLMTVTLHDRLLFEQIEQLQTHSPETIRGAALSVQASGVAGPDAAQAAMAALEKDQHYLVLTQFVLVTELLKLVGVGAHDLLGPGARADQSVRLARQALGDVARIVRISPDELSTRVETLGHAAGPAGLPQCPEPGRLRRLMRRLEAFAAALDRWAGFDPSDVSTLGRYVAAVAHHTLELARMRAVQLDKVCSDPQQIIHDAPRFRAAIAGHVDRLSWLLDGWDFLIALWDQAKDSHPETQQTVVAELSRLAPAIPREEAMMADSFDLEALARIQRRWIRLNEDWRTGALDMHAVMRIESVKAGAV